MATDSLAKLKKLQADAQALLDEKSDAFHEFRAITWHQKLVHFVVRVYKSFLRNRCPTRAAALAYTTVLAIVPLLAVVLSISTGLLQRQDSAQLESWIHRAVNVVAPQLDLQTISANAVNAPANVNPAGNAAPENQAEPEKKSLDEVIQNIQSFVQNFQSGKLGVVAIVTFIFVAISLLSTIEQTFNDIWGIGRGRAWFSRVVHYWAAITLGPLFLLAAFGLTSASQFSRAQEWFGLVRFFFVVVAPLAPFAILSLILAALYLLMPNTKVQISAALIGGCIGGCLLQFNNLFNVMYVSRVVTYKQVYGGLAAVPLFLLGLYISWLIVLLGAQVTYAYQNRSSYSQDQQTTHIHQRGRELVGLELMTVIGRRFHSGIQAPTLSMLANEIGISSRLARQILEPLLQFRLVTEISGDESAFGPGRPLNRITAREILDALRTAQGREPATREGPAKQLVSNAYNQILNAESVAANALTLEEIVQRLQPPSSSD